MIDKTDLNELVKNSFGIAMNANDFFAYAAADSVIIDYEDLKWVLPIFKKYGGPGIHACMAYIAKKQPIDPWVNDEYKAAFAAIEQIKPEVYSEY